MWGVATRCCDPSGIGKDFVCIPGSSVAELPRPRANGCDPFGIGCVFEAGQEEAGCVLEVQKDLRVFVSENRLIFVPFG